MPRDIDRLLDFQVAAKVVRDAGGKVVGRTRLQKIAYILELTGLGEGFEFEYRHYGPYSEDLAKAVQRAELFDFLEEEERPAQWGGTYAIYTASLVDDPNTPLVRQELAKKMASAGSIELELAATAAFLSNKGVKDPWGETKKRKPEKAGSGRLGKAKQLYNELRKFQTPVPLPNF